MRKLWLLIPLVLVILFAPLVLKRADGVRIMTLSDLLSFDRDLIKSRYVMAMKEARRVLVGGERDRQEFIDEQIKPRATTVYKWKDEKGEWQFSDVMPDVEGVEVIKIDRKITPME